MFDRIIELGVHHMKMPKVFGITIWFIKSDNLLILPELINCLNVPYMNFP